MTNTPARPGPFDPLQDADPDCPFFPLMGTDEFAPGLVLEWADKTRTRARGTEDTKERLRLFAKCNEAEEIAWAMQRYIKTGSTEDVRARPTRSTYGGATGNEDHDRRELVLHAVSSLREADYYACEARDALTKLELLTAEDATTLHDVMQGCRRVAEAHEPKRALPVEEPKLPLAAGEAA